MKLPKVGGLILAAGASSRMGENKALLEIAGRRIIDRLVDAFTDAGLEPVVVVASGEAQRHCVARGIEVVVGDPKTEMVDSLIRGLDALYEAVDAVVMQPVDAAFTTPAMIAALLGGDNRYARILCHESQPGHPVLLPKSLFDPICERPRGGLRGLLAERDVELVEWPDAAVLADIDTPERLQAWRERASAKLLH